MTRQKRTDGYRERLLLALREGPRPMSVRQLADRLGGNEEKGIEGRYPDLRGTSYGGVRLYAEKGGSVRNPRVDLLRAMADVLDIRGDWLAFDEGAMTEAEELVRGRGVAAADIGGGKGAASIDPTDQEVSEAFLEGLPALARAGVASWHVLGDLYHQYTSGRTNLPAILGDASKAYAKARHDLGTDPPADQRAEAFGQLVADSKDSFVNAATEVAKMVAAGANAAGVDLGELSRWEIDRYIQSSAQALQILFGPNASATTLRDDTPKGD